MSWLHIALVTWLGVGLLGALVFILLLVKGAGLRRRDFVLNPIVWIPFLALWILGGLPLLIILFAVVFIGGPVDAVMTRLGYGPGSRAGRRPAPRPFTRFFDRGLMIYNPAGTVERVVEWSNVERVEEVFTPPVLCPHLVLRDGERVPLYMLAAEELVLVLDEHGIPFDRRWQQR